MKNKHQLLALIILATLLTPIAQCSSPTFTIETASETSGSLPIDGDATIKVVTTWDSFTANATIDIKLYNSTDNQVATLETSHQIPVTDINGTLLTDTDTQGPDGEYSQTYTGITGLSEEPGTNTYTVKLVDSTSGIVYASKDLVINVAEEDITLGVTWQDTDNNRIIDTGESVTFTYHVDWVFIQDTETHTVWVAYNQDDPQQRGTISITQGSGSSTGTFTKGWNTDGTKTVTVELRDSAGTKIKTLEIPIKVGGTTPQPQPNTPEPQSSSLIAVIQANPALTIIILSIIALVAYQTYTKQEATEN